MSIKFDNKSRVFYLETPNSSYIINIFQDGYLGHLYWGKKISSINTSNAVVLRGKPFGVNPTPEDYDFTLDGMAEEYPSFGTSDYHYPAFQILQQDGSTITDLRYKKHAIFKGKEGLEGLPATYVENEEEATTLKIHLVDELLGLEVVLNYIVFEHYDAITRHVKIINHGNKALSIKSAFSTSVEFQKSNFELLQLSGEWARERHIFRKDLVPGLQGIHSTKGASSHQHNPFVALLSKNATEDIGEVYGFSLVYSGNFAAQVEVDTFDHARVNIGINPFEFSWELENNCSFQTPEAVMVFSDQGIGGMSRIFHKLYGTRLCRGKYRDHTRPILINNWEATYFDFNEEKIMEIVKEAKKIGIELMVLDDGWFGKRNSDNCSLGDWVVDTEKLPQGLTGLADKVRREGLSFGLWFEPEMVSLDSDLYRQHPNWCLHVNGRRRSQSRNQLILDLSRQDVCDYILEAVSKILYETPISYVKWDMNRNMTEVGSELLPPHRQKEVSHRYILGLYSILERLSKRFPEILFESCSGGGGRFDPGMLYYMPQTWTSDDTDAIERLKIQYGTSLVYPVSSMGSHVSAIPNHQVGRQAPLEIRGNVALSGTFGYEMDLTKCTEDEKSIIGRQVEQCKRFRGLIMEADLYRLLSPFESNDVSWMFVSRDKKEALIMFFRILAKPNPPITRLKLKGLEPSKRYLLNDQQYSGSELMNLGLFIPINHGDGDYQSMILHLREAETI